LVRRLWRYLAFLLARGNVIQPDRLDETVGLAWPRIVTGFAIMSKRTVDLAIIGIAVGGTAVAGLTIANAYWMVGKLTLIGLAGGTLSLVSQNYGGGDDVRAARVVAASLLGVVIVGGVLAAVFGVGARPLVALVGGGPAATDYGATYLVVVAPGLFFEGLNLVASRTYAGAGDTRTPMSIRAGGALLNVVLSGTLVFGAGFGVFGAALGTTLATGVVTLVFAWGMSGRSYLGRGASPIPVHVGVRPSVGLVRQLTSVSAPLAARRIGQGLAVFPLLAVAGTFGPVAVAAVGVGRQVRDLLNSFAWGFSIASSTLVGQALGAAEETLAEVYGREITRLSIIVYFVAAAVVVVAARPIATLFVNGSDIPLTTTFVRVAAVSVVPLGIDGSISGALRGAGDTRIPFLATLAGLYLVALPVAGLGVVTNVGVVALQAALVAETAVPMAVNFARFRTGAWKAISRSYRPGDVDPSD
jgi:putative MATE family efflux protein